MLSRKLCLPNQLESGRLEPGYEFRGVYAMYLLKSMQMAHDKLDYQQKLLKSLDTQEPPLFQVDNKVWLGNKITHKYKSAKLFVGYFHILWVDENHTYLIEQNGHVSRKASKPKSVESIV